MSVAFVELATRKTSRLNVRTVRVLKQIHTRMDGQPICNACHVRDKRNHEVCSICSTLAYPRVRPNGQPVCQLCYARPQHLCTECGEMAPAQTTRPRVLCRRCYGAVVSLGGREPKRDAVRIRIMRQRVRALRADKNASAPTSLATVQMQRVPERPTKMCACCKRDRPRKPSGRLGRSATDATTASPGSAPVAREGLLTIRFEQELLCHACAGKPTKSSCKTCGQLEGRYDSGRCAKCALDDRLTELLIDRTGTISLRFVPLKRLLLEHPHPESVLRWLRRAPKGVEALKALAGGDLEATHAVLDSLGEARSIAFLRSLLVSSGALPERSQSCSTRAMARPVSNVAEDRSRCSVYVCSLAYFQKVRVQS